jgi:hypothetical protein
MLSCIRAMTWLPSLWGLLLEFYVYLDIAWGVRDGGMRRSSSRISGFMESGQGGRISIIIIIVGSHGLVLVLLLIPVIAFCQLGY